jgi:hypothetical protein
MHTSVLRWSGDGRFVIRFQRSDPAGTNPRWNSDGDGVGWNISYHNRVGSNQHIVPNLDWPKNLRAGANVHAISQSRRTTLAGVLEPNRDAVANYTIVSKNGVPADYDSTKMVYSEPTSKCYLAREFDPSENLRHRLDQLIEK